MAIPESQQERTEADQKEHAAEIVRDQLISQCRCVCTAENPTSTTCSCGYHEDLYRCYSQQNDKYFYWVNLFTSSCTCAYYKGTGRPCKHIFAAILLKEGMHFHFVVL